MLMRRLGMLLGALAALAAAPAQAVTLTLVGPGGPVLVGGTLDVAVWAGPPGLGSFPATSLRSFDLDVTYDAAHLGFQSVAFGIHLGTPGLQALTSSGAAGGVVDLAAVSLLSAASLDLLQPDSGSFLLATLRFEALVEDTSALAFAQTVLAGTSGAELEVGDALGTEVQSLTVIPEPGSAWLVALGLAGLAHRRVRPRYPGAAPGGCSYM